MYNIYNIIYYILIYIIVCPKLIIEELPLLKNLHSMGSIKRDLKVVSKRESNTEPFKKQKILLYSLLFCIRFFLKMIILKKIFLCTSFIWILSMPTAASLKWLIPSTVSPNSKIPLRAPDSKECMPNEVNSFCKH